MNKKLSLIVLSLCLFSASLILAQNTNLPPVLNPGRGSGGVSSRTVNTDTNGVIIVPSHGEFTGPATFGGNATQTNGIVDLAVHHTALNVTNVFEVWSGGTLEFFVQPNGLVRHTHSSINDGTTTLNGALAINGSGIQIWDTNSAPVTPGTVVGWFTLTATNGASFRVPLYQ